VNLHGFGFLPEILAAVQVAATVDSIAKGHKKKKKAAEYVPPPAPPSILDSFGAQNRGLVVAGLGAVGLFAILKVAKGRG
jgi:hypothetical protein